MLIIKELKKRYASGLKKLEDPLIRGLLAPRIHLLENDRAGILFIKKDISVFSIPKPLKKALEIFLKGASRSAGCVSQGIPAADFDALLLFLMDRVEPEKEPPRTVSTENKLHRLVINISHSCNLKCKYCYAHGGDYGSRTSLMDEKTAAAVLDKFFGVFDEIENIQFFGGEPLLNIPLIHTICGEVLKRHQAGLIKNPPRFTMVTNGTILTNDVVGLFKKHQIIPTISIDGPPAIHDYLRGKGTFDQIKAFIDFLKKNKNLYSFESTYTAYHLESGCSLKELMNFFLETFGQQQMHIPLVSLPRENPLSLSSPEAEKIYRDAIEHSLENLKTGRPPVISFASRMMDAFLERKPILHYCPAGSSTISVDAAGYVFPCFMFTGIDEFQYGNVFDDDFPDRKNVEKIAKKIALSDKDRHPQCLDCWVSPLCSGCIGNDYFKTKGTLEKTDCGVMKSMAEGFLSKIIDFSDKEPEKIKYLTAHKQEIPLCNNSFKRS